MLGPDEYRQSLSANILLFQEAADLGLEQRVHACPDWTVGQLVVHMAEVYDFWAKVVENRVRDEAGASAIQQERMAWLDEAKQPDFYGSRRALELFADRATRIQHVLSAVDPTQSNWTWWPGNQSAGFVIRRMCHETLIHRWDCQDAHNRATPPEPPVIAADGIDEELTNELTGWPDEHKQYEPCSYHLHCTDGPGEWLVEVNKDQIQLDRVHGKADVAVTGAASDLFLWLWHRTGADKLTIYGDAGRAEDFRNMLEQN